VIASAHVALLRWLAPFAWVFFFGASALARFPAANGIAVEGRSVFVRTTFGMVASKDGGASWRFVCDKAIGRANDEDPSFVLTPKGTLVLATAAGVVASRDAACSYTSAGPIVLRHVVVGRGDVYGVTAKGDARVLVSKDDAQTFAALGPALDKTAELATVAIAESDPARLYVSATRGDDARTAAVFVSYDAGLSWVERPIPLDFGERTASVALVDPKNADHVWVLTGADGPGHVLVTQDAGKTWKSVYSASAIAGLVPSGDRVFVGTHEGVASWNGNAFAPGAAIDVQCLGASGAMLWACSTDKTFLVGASKNGGSSFDAKLHLDEIRGVLECPAESAVAKSCEGEWQKVKKELGLPDGSEPARQRDPGGPALKGRATRGSGSRNPMRAAFGIALVGIAAYYILQRIKKGR
jgi:hypothetical protein